MTTSGVYTIGDKVIGYTERKAYLKWDISPDLRTERKGFLENPYFVKLSWRYFTLNYVWYLLSVRKFTLVRGYQPITERKAYLQYSLLQKSERKFTLQIENRERKFFVEALYTNTPLLLKYPKYYNWEYIPQVLNLEFLIWSFYPLNEDDITIYIISQDNPDHSVILNSGIHKDKFKIEIIKKWEQNRKGYIYRVKVYPDIIFDVGEKIEISITAYDIKGNYLKQGLW